MMSLPAWSHVPSKGYNANFLSVPGGLVPGWSEPGGGGRSGPRREVWHYPLWTE